MAFPKPVEGSRGEVVGAAVGRTIGFAAHALRALQDRFAEDEFRRGFEAMVTLVLDARGRAIVAGMGKSGLVARKIAATLTSTGTPATFLHPAEAGHGDLGMITPDDIVILLTRSGETAELKTILDYCKRFGVPLVAITSRANSSVGRAATLQLRLPAVREACSNELTPTTSTTLQMVFGDALAMALMEVRGFSADDFYTFHPRGRLGARLLKIRDLMARRRDVPLVHLDTPLLDATIEMTRGRLGGTAVTDADGKLVGIFTDGDLRRIVSGELCMTDPVARYMSRDPVTVSSDDLASEALRKMHEAKVLLLLVCDNGRLIGAVHMHDLLAAGVA